MKILTGKLRSISLEAPTGRDKTRPTTAKVREGLNIYMLMVDLYLID